MLPTASEQGNPTEVQRAAELLRSCSRPVILVGAEACPGVDSGAHARGCLNRLDKFRPASWGLWMSAEALATACAGPRPGPAGGRTSAMVLGRLVNVERTVWVLQQHVLDTGFVLI